MTYGFSPIVIQFTELLKELEVEVNLQCLSPEVEAGDPQRIIVEVKRYPYVYKTDEATQAWLDIIDLVQEETDKQVFYNVSLSKIHSQEKANKSFQDYEDALEFYESIDADVTKQINAKILH